MPADGGVELAAFVGAVHVTGVLAGTQSRGELLQGTESAPHIGHADVLFAGSPPAGARARTAEARIRGVHPDSVRVAAMEGVLRRGRPDELLVGHGGVDGLLPGHFFLSGGTGKRQAGAGKDDEPGGGQLRAKDHRRVAEP